MATPLSPSVLSGKASKGQFKGLKRTEIIKKKIKAGLPFTLVDGTSIKFTKYTPGTKVFTAANRQTYPLNQVIKDEDLGGQPDKKAAEGELKLGGTITEGLSEGFFCVYLALLIAGKLSNFSPADLKSSSGDYTLNKFKAWCSSQGISTMLKYQLLDTQFTKECRHYYRYLITKKGRGTMDDVFREQAKSFDSARNVSLDSGFFLQRQGMLKETGADPYEVFAMLSKKIKGEYHLPSAPKDDKWNPGDVWALNRYAINELAACSQTARDKAGAPGPYQVGVLNDLNECVQRLWEEKNLYPISLKLPGGHVHITLENEKGPKALAKVIRFEKIKLANSNQDIQIYFDVDYVEMGSRKMVEQSAFKLKLKTKTRSGGHRFEIESQRGGGARYGTVGMGSQEYIVHNTAPGGVSNLNKFRDEHPDLKDSGYLDTSEPSKWINADEMTKKWRENDQQFLQDIQPYFEEMYNLIGEGGNPIPGKKPEWYLNKAHSAEIGMLINGIQSTLVKSQVVQNIYDIANSQKFAVGLTPQRLKTFKEKKRGNGCKELEEIDPSNMTAFKVLFESSLHYVVK